MYSSESSENMSTKIYSFKFYPFCESDKELYEKIPEDMTGGLSIAFTRTAVVDKTFIRSSTNLRKSIVVISASQLYSFSMCQEMPTRVHTRDENLTLISKNSN